MVEALDDSYTTARDRTAHAHLRRGIAPHPAVRAHRNHAHAAEGVRTP
ncbi:hypothetical protein GZL_07047 [Streptomyces sp. 769]|nr:hypothetical protein GZL_07047 [Streptomyces sp. 769]